MLKLHKTLGLLTALGLAVGAVPAGAAPAQTPAADSPRPAATAGPAIVATKTSGEKALKRVLRFNYALPALTGASAKATRSFASKVAGIVAAEEAAVAKAKACSAPKGDPYTWAELSITFQGAVYAGRYASATLIAEGLRPHCSAFDYAVPHSVTVDLRTGRSVAMSKLVNPNGVQFESAVIKSFPSNNPKCSKDSRLRALTPSELGAPDAWNASASGVSVWFKGNTQVGRKCSVITGFVPWRYILKPADISGKKTYRTYWVRGLNKSTSARFGYTGAVAV
ncbi:MAG: hypothetical protein LBT54_04610, partial [Bifidobacteriaceae bacterium]|nr:hypothetical protein [Bifidobacteriaceae bacterium]